MILLKERTGIRNRGYPSMVLRDGAVGYWRLREVRDTVARDECLANDGTYTPNSSGSWTGGTLAQPGPLNRDNSLCAKLTAASSGYITLPAAAFALGSAGSLEAWVKGTDGTGGIIERFLSPNGVRLLFFSGQLGISVGNGTTAPQVFSGTTYNDGAWHHAVATWDGTNCRIYADGVLKGTAAATAPTAPASGNTRIGRSSDQGFLDNNLCEVAAYNVTLTLSQIISHYRAGIDGTRR